MALILRGLPGGDLRVTAEADSRVVPESAAPIYEKGELELGARFKGALAQEVAANQARLYDEALTILLLAI